MNDKKKIIQDFIKKHTICTLATVSPKRKPEAAIIEFVGTENLELIFDTFSTYRKYQNLQASPFVAVVIGWDENITVQYEGEAQELSGEELKKYQDIYFAKNPDARKWQKFGEITYFKVRPKWIRYRDGNTEPMTIFEMRDF